MGANEAIEPIEPILNEHHTMGGIKIYRIPKFTTFALIYLWESHFFVWIPHIVT